MSDPAHSVVSLYSGAGGFSLGVLCAGFELRRAIRLDRLGADQSRVSIGSNLKDSVGAATRVKFRRLLTKYDYPPGHVDHKDDATEPILGEAELLKADSA